jgi:hypothetical membrane protein
MRKIFAACGILAPLAAFSGIFLALAAFPSFSWEGNALSDLGRLGKPSAAFFNTGLIAGGILSSIFAIGLFSLLQSTLGKVGSLALFLDSLALAAIGIFPSGSSQLHFAASVAFFALFPIAGVAVGASLGKISAKASTLTFLLGALAALPWAIHLAFPFGSNVAIPEFLSSLSAGIWEVSASIAILRQSAQK